MLHHLVWLLPYRPRLVFDMIVSSLHCRGMRVTFVRNFTDIDDTIINRAAKQGATRNLTPH
jgi:cysteinyl-tRNA synthetase